MHIVDCKYCTKGFCLSGVSIRVSLYCLSHVGVLCSPVVVRTAAILQYEGATTDTTDDDENDTTKMPATFALVANCGDSRLLTDDGTGIRFRQVTRDHRPEDSLEWGRLAECQRRGEAYLARTQRLHTLRIFPGGLALSRDIGDVAFCKGVIPTPDVFLLKLDDVKKNNDGTVGVPREPTTHRFVIASDGLWDFVSNEQVGLLAARIDDADGSVVDPHAAVRKVMEFCLGHEGYFDDVTIIIMDVTV
jgi:serine/threonine protein phosphatase PrpC